MVNSFGMQLGVLRTKQGMTGKRLAELAGVDRTYLSQVERGRRDPPTTATVARIVAPLGLTKEEEIELTGLAANQRILRALGDVGVQSPVLCLARDIIQQFPLLDAAGYKAVAGFINFYASSRHSTTEPQPNSNGFGTAPPFLS